MALTSDLLLIWNSDELQALPMRERALMTIHYRRDFPLAVPITGKVLVPGTRVDHDKKQLIRGVLVYLKYVAGKDTVVVGDRAELLQLIQANHSVESNLSESDSLIYTQLLNS